ncbi:MULTISPECIES: hypothetical protein [Antrihabitans]|uniref:Uncharacterized protein n=2 Tax=Antrihabitans TaxID=2799491 RepID=A0A934NV47_9NOCA|nr:hypothetical protein [Antrihabitans stalagmiti]MBJ8341767.1 hypothetical protein [Antrihabitans stalagmiti]
MDESRRAGSWFRRLFARGGARSRLDPTRSDLVVVASCFDDAEACSAALQRAVETEPRLDPDAELLLRHHLFVPERAVSRVSEIAAQDGYLPAEPVLSNPDGLTAVVLQRVQRLDALHCSQERSRMAGLAQRHDGHVAGWDAMQPG